MNFNIKIHPVVHNVKKKSGLGSKVAVLGGGSFGTAMAHLLAQKGLSVALWARDVALVQEINTKHTSQNYLPGIKLAGLAATADVGEALHNASFVYFAVPCQHIREVIGRCNAKIPADAILVNLAKGIEIGSLKTPREIFSDCLGETALARYASISGPTFAAELCLDMPSGASVASLNPQTASAVQQITSLKFFRLYTVADLVGVELAGALKNVMAIAVAIADGLGFGHNTRAGLITRCLHEMIELGVAMGAKERTFSGLSGIGDLILTCTGGLSRNRQVGLRLGAGEKTADILKSLTHVAEGIPTAKAANELRLKHKIEMPNTEHVYKILYEGMAPKEAVERILSRELKKEH